MIRTRDVILHEYGTPGMKWGVTADRAKELSKQITGKLRNAKTKTGRSKLKAAKNWLKRISGAGSFGGNRKVKVGYRMGFKSDSLRSYATERRNK